MDGTEEVGYRSLALTLFLHVLVVARGNRRRHGHVLHSHEPGEPAHVDLAGRRRKLLMLLMLEENLAALATGGPAELFRMNCNSTKSSVLSYLQHVALQQTAEAATATTPSTRAVRSWMAKRTAVPKNRGLYCNCTTENCLIILGNSSSVSLYSLFGEDNERFKLSVPRRAKASSGTVIG